MDERSKDGEHLTSDRTSAHTGTPAQHHKDPCSAAHLPRLLSKGPRGHQENTSVLTARLDAEDSKKAPLAPTAWEHRAAKDRMPFLPPVSSWDILRQQETED